MPCFEMVLIDKFHLKSAYSEVFKISFQATIATVGLERLHNQCALIYLCIIENIRQNKDKNIGND